MLLVVWLAAALSLAGLLLTWALLRVFCRSGWKVPILQFHISVAVLHTVWTLLRRGGRPRFPEWTIALEFVQTIVRCIVDKNGAILVENESNAQAFRKLTDLLGSLEGWISCKQHHTTLQPVVLNGLEHLWIRGDEKPNDPVRNADRYVVLYFHGGGYVLFTPRFYIALCNRLRHAILQAVNRYSGVATKPIQVDVFVANYRKAPEAKYPVPQQDALLMYEYLRDHEGIPSNRLVLAGDSAGGGLVLSTLMRLRDAHKANTAPVSQPLAAVLSFPWCDLTEDDGNPGRGQHCILSRTFIRASLRSFLPTWNDATTWKDASSVHCELSGLAPALVQVGTLDYLYQDSIKLHAKAQKDGATDWELDTRENMPHVFSTLPPAVVPDSARAVVRMAEFVAKHIASQSTE